jgi:diketogulonate reductase-like aldo/keto reductase
MSYNNFIPRENIGLGTWQKDPDSFDISETIYQSIKIGYRCFDCAYAYHNEHNIGKGFKKAFDKGIVTRDELFIIGKATTMSNFNKSLENLGIDKFNLALFHSYNEPSNFDLMIELKAQGKTDYIGVSNIYINKLKTLIKYCEENNVEKPVVIENEINFFDPLTDIVDFCANQGIKTIAYSPLGQQGLNYILENDCLQRLAEKYQITIPQLLLVWSIKRGNIPIPASTNYKRLKENFDTIELSKNPYILTIDEIQEITTNGFGNPIIEMAYRAKESDNI